MSTPTVWLAPTASSSRVATRVESADVRLLQHTSFHARHRELLADECVVVTGARAHVKDADVLPAELSRDLRADIDRLRRGVGGEPDSPTEERIHEQVTRARAAAEVEEGRAVEKKSRRSGKNRENRVRLIWR
jgi:hypothetical protein